MGRRNGRAVGCGLLAGAVIACGGVTRVESTSEVDASAVVADAASESAVVSETDSSVVDADLEDVDAAPLAPLDGSAGEGCSYVSGDYVVRNGNNCDSIIVSCPHGLGDASFAACAAMCPRDGAATAFRCWQQTSDASVGAVLISCLAPNCQG